MSSMPACLALEDLPFDVAPWRLSGNVYGVLMNHRGALAALGDAANQPPYKAPPRAPVLYVKPRNTLVGPGRSLQIDVADGRLEIGAALGIVIGRTACAVPEAEAPTFIAGYVIVCDASLPHDTWYRPSVRLKARDASCAIGPHVVPRADIADADSLGVRVYVDKTLAHRTSTGGTMRSVARLVADVSEFMTLSPGDVLLAGVAPGAPQVAAGSTVAIDIDGLGRWEARVEAPPMERVR